MTRVYGVALLAMAALPAVADSGLAEAKNCLHCHAPAIKLVGPAFQDIARKYAGVEGAEDALVKKVLTGSWGSWGWRPMPPNKHVTESEARLLVKWVLNAQ